MTELDKIRAEHGDCVVGTIILTPEEHRMPPKELAVLLGYKAQNLAMSLLESANARWGVK